MGIVRIVLLVSYGVAKKIDGTNLFQGSGKYWINPENGCRSCTLILRHVKTVQSRQVLFEGETHVKNYPGSLQKPFHWVGIATAIR